MKKDQKSQKKKVAAAAGAFAAVAVLSATFAWFESKDQKKNHFEGEIATGQDIEIVETFTPPTDWKPGEKVNKDVAVANVGEYKAYIRVGLEEQLQLLSNDAIAKETADGSEIVSKTSDEIYLVPSTSKLDMTGYNPSKLAGAAPTITLSGAGYAGTYTLKVYEKVTGTTTVGTTTTTQYTYRQFWEDASGKKYRVQGVEHYTRAADDTVTLVGTPKMSYIDLTYAAAVSRNWTKDDTVPRAAYVPSKAFTDGDNWVETALVKDGTKHHPIEILFNNITATPAVGNKWYFNADDGFFYYMAVVDPGGTTAQLIDDVKLTGEADNKYSKLKYDLVVNAQGISAFKEAVKTWVTGNAPLQTALESIGDE